MRAPIKKSCFSSQSAQARAREAKPRVRAPSARKRPSPKAGFVAEDQEGAVSTASQ